MSRRSDMVAGYYETARDNIVAFVERRTADRALAEDIVQDAFLRLLTSGGMIAVTTLPALAFTVVRNLLADHFRRLSCAREYAGEKVHAARHAADASCLCSRHEVEQWLERGMARLPERCREAYRLHVVDGMKISEIRRATGYDYKQLERNLGLARRQMRLYMKRFAS